MTLPTADAEVRRRSADRLLGELDRVPMRKNATGQAAPFILVAAACIAVGFAIGAATTAGSSKAATSALGFEPSAGWNVVSTGAIPLARGQAAVATNERFRKEDAPAGSFPQSTIGHLRPEGIVIWVFATPRGRLAHVDAAFTPRKLPLRLDEARILHGWEGQPNPRVPEYGIWSAVDRVNVDARVYFGTQKPPVHLRVLAQRELARLLVPQP